MRTLEEAGVELPLELQRLLLLRRLDHLDRGALWQPIRVDRHFEGQDGDGLVVLGDAGEVGVQVLLRRSNRRGCQGDRETEGDDGGREQPGMCGHDSSLE